MAINQMLLVIFTEKKGGFIKMNEKILYKLYLENIDDVALDISQTAYWRKKLFEKGYEQKILISKEDIEHIPEYIEFIFTELDLMFLVSKVRYSPEFFDKGSIIFKFEALPFPSIFRFTGN